jgi:hypothetical protein
MIGWMGSVPAWKLYLAGALLALAWKYISWCYIGTRRMKKSWRQSSREWFELQTIDAKVSWLATGACVWAIGAIYIRQIGLAWIFGGALTGLPVFPEMAFLLGVLAEYTAPAILKWLATKIPFLNTEAQ